MKRSILFGNLWFVLSLVVVGVLALATTPAQAVDLYWDTNGTGANAGTAGGVWDTTAYWYTDQFGGGTPTATPTANDNLFFSAGTNALLVGSNVPTLAASNLFANKITFDDPVSFATNTVQLGGGATSLTLGNGSSTDAGIYISSAASGGYTQRVRISQAITLAANATFQNDSPGASTLWITGGVGTAAFNVTLKNNSFIWGGVWVDGGLNNTGTVTNSGTGIGDVTINSGVIGPNVNDGSNGGGANGVSVIQNSWTSELITNTNHTYVGATKLSQGIFHIVGGNINATGAGPLGSGGKIIFDGGILQFSGSGTMGALASGRFFVTTDNDYKLETGFNAATVRSMTVDTTLPTDGTNGLHKYGPGTLTISAAQNYTGTTTIGGIDAAGQQVAGSSFQNTTGSLVTNLLTVSSTLNGTIGTPLTFAGTGTFTYSGNMQGLTLSGGDATLTNAETFASLAARSVGATVNFQAASILTNSANAPLGTSGSNDPGFFYSGAGYARYAGGSFRAVIYGSDNNAPAAITGAVLGVVNDGTQDVQIASGGITAQTTASVNTVSIPGSNNIALASGAALSVNGILKSGNNASFISGGAGIKPVASGGELVIRTDLASDVLTVATPLAANGANTLTKSGLGTLRLTGANAYVSTGVSTTGIGTIAVNGGALVIASPANTTYSGLLSGSGNLVFTGPGVMTLNGSVPNTYTGLFNVTNGTLVADFSNMTTPQQLLSSRVESNTMQSFDALGRGSDVNGPQGGGVIKIIGKSGTTTVQKFGANSEAGTPQGTFNVTGMGKILVDPNGQTNVDGNGDGTQTYVTLGCLSQNMLLGYAVAQNTAGHYGTVYFTSNRYTDQFFGSGGGSYGRVYWTTNGGTTVDFTNSSGSNQTGGYSQRIVPFGYPGGSPYIVATTSGGGGYQKLTGTAITDVGGIYTMAGPFNGGKTGGVKIESPVGGQSLVLSGDNTFGAGGLLTDGTGSGTFTISNGRLTSAASPQNYVAYFAIYSGVDVDLQTEITSDNYNGLVKNGTGKLILSSANSAYANTTWLNEGTLQVNAANTVGIKGPLGASGMIQFAGGILQYGPSSGSFDYSSRFSTTATSAFRIDTNGNAVTFASAIGGNTASQLIKSGTGALTLTGANLYAGATYVDAGTLALSGSGSIANSASIAIRNTATLDTTLKTGGFTMLAAQPVTFDINPAGGIGGAGSAGLLNATSLDITNGNVVFNLIGLAPLDDPYYVLANYTAGLLTGTQFASATAPAGYAINYAYGVGANQIALVVIPEPSTLILLVTGLLGLLAHAWRRRRAAI